MNPAKPVAGYYRVSLARDNMKAPELYEDEIKRYWDVPDGSPVSLEVFPRRTLALLVPRGLRQDGVSRGTASEA